ncbi:hypothetical protein CLPU_10c00260 [Gottschalkia purinilytica]|uniref:Uncharacterized protein n=1 Tax=Gottschalkia purinilytica TaxID=1503 RepID=A0A0L0W961_GOTPU|nr:hypothetical protein [Gottschalkia purinilytica]KNF07972.1 hypothetical protein CLPU_10c00260 [Gottschalkia purinilytica]
MKPFIFTTGELTESGHKAANKVSKEANMIKNYGKREDLVDDSFLKKAMEGYKNKKGR